MLERLALRAALDHVAQSRELLLVEFGFEFKIELEPRKLEHTRDHVFRVRTRAFDPVLREIRSRGLQDFEQRLRLVHERDDSISRSAMSAA